MTRPAVVQSWSLGLTLLVILAAAVHQGFATVAPPTPAQTTAAPHKGPERPERGQYNVTGTNGTACLLAYMGLQLNISIPSQNKTVIININPDATKSSGSCESKSARLQLSADSDKTILSFVFSVNTTSKKYHLSEVNLTTVLPDMNEPFSAENRSLDYLEGTLGHSYMCRKELTLAVVPDFSINTFDMQLQPFLLVRNEFSSAEECQLDEDDMLIPIIVGGALASLVLIVLAAYLIGRKRSHAGYQTI